MATDLAAAAAELFGAANRFSSLAERGRGPDAGDAAAFAGDGFEVHVRTAQGQLLVTVSQAAAVVVPTGAPASAHASESELLSGEQVVAVLVGSLCLCALLHALAPTPSQVRLTGPRLTYWRRLVRAQLYYLLASIAGPVLLMQYSSREELLFRFTSTHQVAFAASIAHWICATVEDLQTYSFLAQGIERAKGLGEMGSTIILRGYVAHHVATIGIIGFSLWSQKLSAVPVLGFCFEMPVFFMNVREFLHTFNDAWGVRLSKVAVARLWGTIFWLFLLSRGGSHALYFYSVAFWGPTLAALPAPAWYVYHAASLLFLALNYAIFRILLIWADQDTKAPTADTKAPEPQRGAVGSGGGASMAAPAVHDMENPDGAASAATPARGPRGGRAGPPQTEAEAGRAAAAREDAACRAWKLGRGYRFGSFYAGPETVDMILHNLLGIVCISSAAHWCSAASLGLGGEAWSCERRGLFAGLLLFATGCVGASTAVGLGRLPQVLGRCASPAVHFASLCLVSTLASCAHCWQSPAVALIHGAAIALVVTEGLQSRKLAMDHLALVVVSFHLFDWSVFSVSFGLSLAGFLYTAGKLKGESPIVSKSALAIVAGIYSACGLLVYWRAVLSLGSAAIGMLSHVWIPVHFQCLVGVVIATNVYMSWFDSVVTLCWLLNASMVTRAVCYTVLLCHLGNVYVMIGWALHARRMMLETRRALREPGTSPAILCAVEQMDMIRSFVLSIPWRLIVDGMVPLLNTLMPEDLMVYAFPFPFPRITPGLSCGLAVQVQGPRDVKPSSFVCNVGYIPGGGESHDDISRTARASFGILREFAKSNMEEIGLVGNILCTFPQTLTNPTTKEFNFSAWKSDKHAYDWYVHSPEHKEVMAEHKNGVLTKFGNTLMNLKLSRGIRWQGRCSDKSCASVVEGYPEVRECECGAPVFDMPLF